MDDRSDIISRISNVLLTQKSIRTNKNFGKTPSRDQRRKTQQSQDKREINVIEEDVENEMENANPTIIQKDISKLVRKEKQIKFLGQLGKSKSNVIDKHDNFIGYRKQRTQMRMIDQLNNIPDESSIFTEDMSYIEVNSKLIDMVSNSQFKSSNQTFLISKDDPSVILGFYRIARMQQLKKIFIDNVEQELFGKPLQTYKSIKINELIPLFMNKLGLNQYESLRFSRFLVEEIDEKSDDSENEESEQQQNIIFDENRKAQAPLISVRLMANSIYPQIFNDKYEYNAKQKFQQAFKNKIEQFQKIIEVQSKVSEQNLITFQQFQSLVKQEQENQLDEKTIECCYIILCRSMSVDQVKQLPNKEFLKKLIGFESSNLNLIYPNLLENVTEDQEDSRKSYQFSSQSSQDQPTINLQGVVSLSSLEKSNNYDTPITPVIGYEQDYSGFSSLINNQQRQKTGNFQKQSIDKIAKIAEIKQTSLGAGSQSSIISTDEIQKQKIFASKGDYSFKDQLSVIKHQSTESKIQDKANPYPSQQKLYSVQDLQSNTSNIKSSQNEDNPDFRTTKKDDLQQQINKIEETTEENINENEKFEDKQIKNNQDIDNNYSDSRSDTDYDMQQSIRKDTNFKFKINEQNSQQSNNNDQPLYNTNELQIIKNDIFDENDNVNDHKIENINKDSQQQVNDIQQNFQIKNVGIINIQDQENIQSQAFINIQLNHNQDYSKQSSEKGSQSPGFQKQIKRESSIDQISNMQKEQKIKQKNNNLVSFNRKDSDEDIIISNSQNQLDKLEQSISSNDQNNFNHSFSCQNQSNQLQEINESIQKDIFVKKQMCKENQDLIQFSQQQITTISCQESLQYFEDNNINSSNEFDEMMYKKVDSQLTTYKDNSTSQEEKSINYFNNSNDDNQISIQTDQNISYEKMFGNEIISKLKQKLENIIENKIDASIRMDINKNSMLRVIDKTVEVLCQIAINLKGNDSNLQKLTVRELLKGRIYTIKHSNLQDIQDFQLPNFTPNSLIHYQLNNDLEVIRSIDMIQKFNQLIQDKTKKKKQINEKNINLNQEECLKTIFQNQKCFDFIFLHEIITVFEILNVQELRPQKMNQLDYNQLDMKSIRILNRFLNFFVSQVEQSYENPITFNQFMSDIVYIQNVKKNQEISEVQVFQASSFFQKLKLIGVRKSEQIYENLSQFFQLNNNHQNILVVKKFKKCLLYLKTDRFFISVGERKNKLIINDQFHQDYQLLDNSDIYAQQSFQQLDYEAGPDTGNQDSSIYYSKISYTDRDNK